MLYILPFKEILTNAYRHSSYHPPFTLDDIVAHSTLGMFMSNGDFGFIKILVSTLSAVFKGMNKTLPFGTDAIVEVFGR